MDTTPPSAKATETVNSDRRRFLGSALCSATALAVPSWAAPAFAGQVTPFSPAPTNPHASPVQMTSAVGNPHAAGDFWSQPRVLNLKRYQTNEALHLSYWKDGRLDMDGYRRVCWLMRDTRAGQASNIDLRVLDLLCAMQAWVAYYGFKKPFLISSGFRTLHTNNNLEGAAKNSMHLQGKAVDLIFPDLPVNYIGQLAQHYSAGGVGFYPSRGFVHVDTGRIRSWRK